MIRQVSEADLTAAAEALGRSLTPGAVVWLSGALGAGKTTFVRGMLRGLGSDDPVTSPTFGLVHRYDARRGPVYHVDCYRLRRADEAAALDWAALAGGDALLIEWPERAGEWPPPPDHRVTLGHAPDPDRRTLEIE